MEVVGAASAIITVAQIAAALVSICYDYQNICRHYPKDVVTITHELQSLRNVLERLADIVNSQDGSSSIALPTFDSLNLSGGPLEMCRVELKQLALKLAPAEGRLQQVSRALKWPLKEKDVKETLGSLARQRGLFQLALTMDQTTTTLAMKTVMLRNEDHLIALDRKSHAVTLQRRNEQIFQWLAAPDSSSTHNKACQKKQRGTGRWLMSSMSYIKWKKQQASFLWLHGIPGCGKTILCSTIIEDIASTCQASNGNILAYFYFLFNDSEKQTCEGLIRSLIAQLSGQSLASAETIEALFTECEDGQRAPTHNSLVQALRDLSEQYEQVYLVLDALDECVEVPAVISLIQEIRGWHNSKLHILVTSRKEAILERRIRLLITDQVQVQNVLVDADIKLHVRECLRKDTELSQWSESIKAEIEKTLCEGSKGMFRWAVCQLDILRRCIKPAALRKALASLPKTLDETYERILCNIDQEYAEDALKVLQWLAFSARPLELQEVAEATAVTLNPSPKFDPEDRLRHPQDLLAICSSLISVSARSTGVEFRSGSKGNPLPRTQQPDLMSMHGYTCSADSRSEEDFLDESRLTQNRPRYHEIRLAHESVKEYLVSERIKKSKAAFYSINEATTNVFLASSCLTYLMHLKSSPNELTASCLSEYPLLRYSAQEWESHLNSSGDLSRDTLLDCILREFFLTPNFSFNNWLVISFDSYPGSVQRIEEKVDDALDLNLEGRLYHASRLGLLDICKMLIEQGVSADPPTKSKNGFVKSLSTPLQIAAFNGNEAVVRLLLDHGANINQRSIHASTLDYAVTKGRESIVRILLERGAEVTIDSASPYYGLKGLASLVLAARAGHVGIVKLVLENGKYPKPRNSYCEAYQEAIAHGHQDIANLLLEYGAEPSYLTGDNDSDDSDVEYFDVKQ